jgi:hypothetical protein
LSVFNETSPFKLSDIQPEITDEELQLRRKLAELESKRGVTTSQSLFMTNPMIEQSSNQLLPIWNVTPTKGVNPFLSKHVSSNFLVPSKQDDLKSAEQTGKISITTHAVTVNKVEFASAENLMRLKLDLEEGRQKGHYDLIRDSYISEAARMTINDAISRVHREQAKAAFQQGKQFPQYQDYEWLEWNNDKFFEVIPPLLRLEQTVAVNPMTNCLAQLRKLRYVYDNIISQGESQLQIDARKVFKNTRVWLSVIDNEDEAIWKQNKQDGPKWLKSIFYELNIVIMAGTDNTRRVLMIGAELKESEKLYSSTSITAYFIKLKDTAYKHRPFRR